MESSPSTTVPATAPASPAASDPPFRVLSYDVGTVNMGVCAATYDSTPKRWLPLTIDHWEVINLRCRNSSKGGVYAFVDALESRPWSRDYRRIVIESQHNNNRMKALAHGMLGYHYTSALIRNGSCPRKDVTFVSPRFKLSVHTRLFGASGEPNDRMSYGKRKKLAVSHVTAILSAAISRGELEASWLTWFKSLAPKQDDAADAFLQLIHEMLQHRDHLERPRKGRRRKRKAPQSTTWRGKCVIPE